jgi:hypothetical protein
MPWRTIALGEHRRGCRAVAGDIVREVATATNATRGPSVTLTA